MTNIRRSSSEGSMDEVMASYRVPPEPPLDEMWARIERVHFRKRGWHTSRRLHAWLVPAMSMAAGLLVGVGLGRYVMPTRVWSTGVGDTAATQGLGTRASNVDSRTQTGAATLAGGSYAGTYGAVTTEYFGDAAALLRTLPTDANDRVTDGRFVNEAGELLATTRLLLDSPAASDPELRALLDDLELVLAQIARLRTTRGDIELDLIASTLEQRDVIPRLDSAAAIRYGSNN